MWSTIIAGGMSLIGSTIGANERARGNAAAGRSIDRAVDTLEQVNVPDADKLKLLFENPNLVGTYTPEVEQALNLESTALENISVDPELKQQQMEALESLGEVAEGGLTEGDKAASRMIQREVAQSDAARRKSILQNMAQRGTLGSGMELAAQLDAAQSAADEQSAASDRLQQQAQARALQALRDSGNMASSIRSQDYGEQSDLARARDVINKYNVSNQQNVGQRNISNLNEAQLLNLKAKQALENKRALNKNEQDKYNNQLIQDQFNNELNKNRSISNALTGKANTQRSIGSDSAAGIGGAASGLANIVSAFGSQQKIKNDTSDMINDDDQGIF